MLAKTVSMMSNRPVLVMIAKHMSREGPMQRGYDSKSCGLNFKDVLPKHELPSGQEGV